jgi:hypothetical protein
MKPRNSCWEDECVIELKVQVARLEEKINANERGVFLSEEKIMTRLEGLNEFRGIVKDNQALCITRSEFETKHKNLEDKIDTVSKFMWGFGGAIVVLEFILKYVR